MSNWNIKEILNWTTRYFSDKGIEESRFEAEILLAHVLKKDRVYLYTDYERPIDKNERELYREYIRRRASGEPIAYIMGTKEFMSLEFKVTPDVLIPRPDTEILVEKAITIAENNNFIHNICDVGTGSGAIAVSLAYYLKEKQIYGSDISSRALEVANYNALKNNVKINFTKGDLLQPYNNKMKFELITANLPYISETDYEKLDFGVKNFEPKLALIAEDNGLHLYKKLISQASKVLEKGGFLLIEIASNQVNEAIKIFKGYVEIEIITDLAGRDRVIKARKGY